MRRALRFAVAAGVGGILSAAPAAAHDIHVEPSVDATLLKRGVYVHHCGSNGACPVDRHLRTVEVHWSTGCTLRGDEIRHHWEVGLRTAVRPGSRRDPLTFGGTPAIVDGAYAPVVKPKGTTVSPQDDVFTAFPEALAAFADGAVQRGGSMRLGVLPGSVVAAHLGASCLTTEDGDGSEFVGVDSRDITVRPRAVLVGHPQLRAGRTGRVRFDFSGNATSLVRTTGRGFSGAVLRIVGAGIRARTRLSAADVANGRTIMRVRPRRGGPMKAWVVFSGVRSYNDVLLAASR